MNIEALKSVLAVSITDAARFSGYSPHMIRNLIDERKVEARKEGQKWMILTASLLTYFGVE